MKMKSLEQVKFLRTDKKGSSTVFMTMVIVSFMVMIILSIDISRRMVIKSQAKSFGRVWAKAILSEYDVHLFEDYNLLAFKGNDTEVSEKLDRYIGYSFDGKMKSKVRGSHVSLGGYEMRDPKNFLRSIRNGLTSEALDTIINGKNRVDRANNTSEISESEAAGRKIGNNLVLDTLPSKGTSSFLEVDRAVKLLKQGNILEKLKESSINAAGEFAFIYKNFDSHVKTAEAGKTYFTNEWEYIIHGKPDDEANYLSCRRKIFLIRNALNIAYLKGDPTKMSLIAAVAEAITPGPLSPATQLLLMELWAAAESEYDVDTLVKGGKVPVLKTANTWKTDLSLVLSGDKFKGSLNDEGLNLLDKNKGELVNADGAKGGNEQGIGNDYEDYLLVLMVFVNENTRILRTMDLVQINMKYRYYEDFNFDEYYTGLSFSIKINSDEYEIKDQYK